MSILSLNDAAEEEKEREEELLDLLNKKAGKKVFRFSFTVKLDKFFEWIKRKIRKEESHE